MRTVQETVTGSFNMMKEPMGHEPDRNDWLGTTLRRSDEASPDACLDEETLAAWADGGLSSQAAAAVDSHASSCSRCMAVLAAMERTAPAANARHAWTPARVFRWLVPLTAAATAFAIWVVVPNRPITSSVTLPAENSQSRSARADATSAPPGVPPQATERGIRNENVNPAPSTKNLEPQAKSASQEKPASAKSDSQAKADFQFRDEVGRERAEPEALNAPAAVAEAPPIPPAAPPPAAASPGVATDSLAEPSAAASRRLTLNREIGAIASTSPSNPLSRWRVVSSRTIERSTDGGKKWMKTVPLPAVSTATPPTILSVRAVNDVRAVARTSDGTEFYTADGGLTWTRVQENSTAPF